MAIRTATRLSAFIASCITLAIFFLTLAPSTVTCNFFVLYVMPFFIATCLCVLTVQTSTFISASLTALETKAVGLDTMRFRALTKSDFLTLFFFFNILSFDFLFLLILSRFLYLSFFLNLDYRFGCFDIYIIWIVRIVI